MKTTRGKRPSAFNKEVISFLLSQNISLFGSSVVAFAIIWYITLETSSGLWLMLSTICSTVPQVVISLWGGVWADRYNRKHLIMFSDGFIALATLGLVAAFWAGLGRLELLLVASVVRSLGAGIQTPAVNALFPQLVPTESLTRVQGINQTLSSLLMLVSPAVGGVVLRSFGLVWAFFIDVITATLAILVMAFIKVDRVTRDESLGSVLAELKEGITYTLSHRLLSGLLICYACSFFLITPAAVLTPLLIERSFGGEVWKLTANEISWTIGSLIGGLFVSWHGGFQDKIRTIAMCLVIFGVTFGFLGLATSFSVYLFIMGAAGFFMPVMATTQTVLIQEITSPSMMGRVFSIIQIIAAGAMPLAILVFGPLADIVSVEVILIVSGALLALVGVLYHRSYGPLSIEGNTPLD